MQIKISIGSWQRTYEMCLTEAPQSYDWFGTFTVYNSLYQFPGREKSDINARLVAIPCDVELRVQTQLARYVSGLHVSRRLAEIPELSHMNEKTILDLIYKRFFRIDDEDIEELVAMVYELTSRLEYVAPGLDQDLHKRAQTILRKHQ